MPISVSLSIQLGAAFMCSDMTDNLTSMGHGGNFMGGGGTSVHGVGEILDNIFRQGAVEFKLESIVSSSAVIRASTGGLSTIFSAIQALPFAQHIPSLLEPFEIGKIPPIFELPSSSIFFMNKGHSRISGMSR